MKGFLPDQTRISQVHLRTTQIDRAVEFYSRVLGLKLSQESDSRAVLCGNQKQPGLLVLSEEQGASPRPPHSIGLYHLALRFATRKDLGLAFGRLSRAGCSIDGASDHGVSEAIYLSDPDGNGVELYVDRPRSSWRWRDGYVEMVTTPLDLKNLLATVPARAETTDPADNVDLGHIHLHVADLSSAERFYSEFLGFAVTQRSYPGALFFAAGGYHHHVGVNVWAGKTVPPANSVGLVSYRVEVPVAEVLYCLNHRAPLLGYEAQLESQEQSNPILRIRDPNGTWLEVQDSSNGEVRDRTVGVLSKRAIVSRLEKLSVPAHS